MKAKNASLSARLPKVASAPARERSSVEKRPVATPIVRAPIALPQAISCGVSPMTKMDRAGNET